MMQKIAATTFRVDGMRVLPAQNSDDIFVIKGTAFWVGEKRLTSTSRSISKKQAASPVFNVDLKANTFTLPNGKRGRRAVAGMSQNDISALLSSLTK